MSLKKILRALEKDTSSKGPLSGQLVVRVLWFPSEATEITHQ